jgi:hypothetical protein
MPPKLNVKHILTAALVVAAVLMSGCGGGTPTTPPAVTVRVTVLPDDAELNSAIAEALTGTAQAPTTDANSRPTLPPTWTPTATATPAPPTATITPTPTPTVTPTLSAEAICDNFFTTHNLRPGQYFPPDSTITIYMNRAAPDATVRFHAVQHWSGTNRGADLPGGQANILQLPIRNLPETGQYDWTLTVKSPAYGDICIQSGYFFVTSRESTRAEEARIQ